MEIRKVGVLGCGLMGSGIAQVAAQAGHPTTVLEVSKDLLDAGLKRIEQFTWERCATLHDEVYRELSATG